MKKLLIVLSALYLYACSSSYPTAYPTAYVAASGAHDYGYSENRLTDNRYRVNFKGNTNTTADEVKDMALLRAAELTLQHRYDWFRVLNQETAETTSTTPATVTTAPQQVYRDCGPLGCTTTIAPAYSGTQVITVKDADRYATSIEIVMGQGRLADPTTVYNAAEIRNSLARRY